MSNIIDSIRLSGVTYTLSAETSGGNNVVELTQAQYDALVTGGTVDPTAFYIITDATAGDLTQYWTSAQTNSAITSAVSGKQDTLVSGTNIKTINNESILGSGNINIQGGGVNVVQTTGTSTTDVMSQDAVTSSLGNLSSISRDNDDGITRWYSVRKHNGTFDFPIYNFSINGKLPLSQQTRNSDYSNIFNFHLVETSAITTSITSGSTDAQVPSAKAVYDAIQGGGGGGSSYTAGTGIDITNNVISVNSGVVTTNTAQDITGNKTFIGSADTSKKPIIFKQANNSHKIGFICQNSASTNNELATFEFRPDTYTDSSSVKHPLLYIGHYRNNNTANAGVVQTMVGFRQYDQQGAAAYHYLMPLPAEAKTPFSLTTSFKNYFAPLGFKNGSTMITADNTGVVDLSTELDGLKLKKLTQAQYDALSPNYDSNTLYVIVN